MHLLGADSVPRPEYMGGSPIPVQPALEDRRSLWGHLTLLLVLSAGFLSLFMLHGLGWFDEAWPLYAAMRLHQGGTLYQDVFFLFPPGHLLAAWIAYSLEPPGIVFARGLYAGFEVALVLSIYLLGRRLMLPSFAFLGAALLAVSAPESHLLHLLFGYRYLVFSVLGLLAFSRRIATGEVRWMLLCGCFAGVSLVFRITPAFALCCGIAVAVPSLGRSIRGWIRDWGSFALGLLVVALPVLWAAASNVGLETVWREVVVRVVGLQSAQSLALPALSLPSTWDRQQLYEFFVALQFRVYPALVLVYALALLGIWARCLQRRVAFPHPLLLATVVWGGAYLLRAIGRSDDHHLFSALPPLCLITAHAIATVFERLNNRQRATVRWERRLRFALCASVFLGWALLMRSDEYLDLERRGTFGLRTENEKIFVGTKQAARSVVDQLKEIFRWSGPNDTILNLSLTPMLYVLSGRPGPGYFDVMMPGTFLDESEELAFLDRLRASPPAVIVYPAESMDRVDSRSIFQIAPHIAGWVGEQYRVVGPVIDQGFVLMVPAERLPPSS